MEVNVHVQILKENLITQTEIIIKDEREIKETGSPSSISCVKVWCVNLMFKFV